MRVFISHSHKDKPFAAVLHKALRDAGVEVWIDEMEILPGDNIVKKIDQGLSSSDAIIVLLLPWTPKNVTILVEIFSLNLYRWTSSLYCVYDYLGIQICLIGSQ
jgi:hypothetical protein